jgi:hypothetical protein
VGMCHWHLSSFLGFKVNNILHRSRTGHFLGGVGQLKSQVFFSLVLLIFNRKISIDNPMALSVS